MKNPRTTDIVWLAVLLGFIAGTGYWFGFREVPAPPRNIPPPSMPARPAPTPEFTAAPSTDLSWLRKPDSQEVVLETRRGKIVFELYPNAAPNHVARIKQLVKSHYYDGLLFHRVIPGFMIQFGDPNTRNHDHARWGTGGGDQPALKAEFNALPHVPGTLSMARTSDPDSATTQFFICVGTPSFLNHQYTVFGQVVQGQAIAEAISKVPRDPRDAPLHDEPVTKAYLIPHP